MLLLGSISIMVLGNIFITGYLINHSCGSRMYLQWCWHSRDNVRIYIQSHIRLTTTYTIKVLWWFWNKIKWQTHVELNEKNILTLNLSMKWNLFLFYFDISWVASMKSLSRVTFFFNIRSFAFGIRFILHLIPGHHDIFPDSAKNAICLVYILHTTIWEKEIFILILTQWTFCRFS